MSATVPCSRCGDFVDPSSALLSDAGDPICAPCSALADVDAGEQRAASAIFAASGSALGLGVIAVVFNPFLAFTILGVLSALGTFGLLRRHPEYRERLGWKLPVTITVATIGLVISATAPVLRIVIALLAAH